ncbi:MAG: MarR family transcriptional regulator [Oscillospiraceae bacterium]|nr:MarR family transcriptional regulator [Oscillospiraceae bacterium]MBQ9721280.1 MarR family transcriptional regulator [Oscillospiraceae bacterium]
METEPTYTSPVFSLMTLLSRLVLTPRAHKDYGCTRMQLAVLSALALRGLLNMSQIAEFIGASKEQATRAVAPMVEAGYVERSVPEENRTHVDIRLTDAGRDLVRGYYRDMEVRIQDRIDAALTQEEHTQLRDALETATTLLMKVN